MSEQRPLPWEAVKVYTGTPNAWQVQDATGWAVANRIDEATALEIVAAVNGREKLVEALKGFVDGECHCHEVGMRKPCVQCVGREALSEGGGQ